MRKIRFNEKQMVAILSADRTSVAEAAKKNKFSEPLLEFKQQHHTASHRAVL